MKIKIWTEPQNRRQPTEREYERSSVSEIRKLPTSASSRPCHQVQLTGPLSLTAKDIWKEAKTISRKKKIELSFLSDGQQQQQRGRMKKSWNQRMGQQKEKQYKMFDRVPIINLQLSLLPSTYHTQKKLKQQENSSKNSQPANITARRQSHIWASETRRWVEWDKQRQRQEEKKKRWEMKNREKICSQLRIG